jgi:hypothetical protein
VGWISKLLYLGMGGSGLYFLPLAGLPVAIPSDEFPQKNVNYDLGRGHEQMTYGPIT